MPRTVRDSKLEKPEQRRRLAVRHEPHWRGIQEGWHLGYYKGRREGSWVARWRPKGGRYRKTTLGRADDIEEADGVMVFNYAQAQDKAREWFREEERKQAGVDPEGGPYTVEKAMRDYLTYFEGAASTKREVEYSTNAFILPELGEVEVAKLTSQRVRDWHRKLAEAAPRLRTRRGQEQRYREADPADPETQRRRRVTANRNLTVLKAALNHAYREGRTRSDDAWRRVKPFKSVDAARVRYLKHDECVRLVNACPADFRRLVQGALFTGCRYGELAKLHVADFNPDSGTVHVRASKSGKARHVVLADEGRAFFEEVTAGRAGSEPIFTREDGSPWGRGYQVRPLRAACRIAKINPPVGFHTLRHTYASHLVMAGAPLQVVAQNLGHADTRMVERHYAHLAPSWVADTIRQVAPTLGIHTAQGKVRPIREARIN